MQLRVYGHNLHPIGIYGTNKKNGSSKKFCSNYLVEPRETISEERTRNSQKGVSKLFRSTNINNRM